MTINTVSELAQSESVSTIVCDGYESYAWDRAEVTYTGTVMGRYAVGRIRARRYPSYLI